MTMAPDEFPLSPEELADLDASERFGRELATDADFLALVAADAKLAATTGFDDLLTRSEFSRRFRENEKKRQQ